MGYVIFCATQSLTDNNNRAEFSNPTTWDDGIEYEYFLFTNLFTNRQLI